MKRGSAHCIAPRVAQTTSNTTLAHTTLSERETDHRIRTAHNPAKHHPATPRPTAEAAKKPLEKRTARAELQAPDPRVLDHEAVRVAEPVDGPAAVVLPHVHDEDLELAAVRHLKRALRFPFAPFAVTRLRHPMHAGVRVSHSTCMHTTQAYAPPAARDDPPKLHSPRVQTDQSECHGCLCRLCGGMTNTRKSRLAKSKLVSPSRMTSRWSCKPTQWRQMGERGAATRSGRRSTP
jgi:hypothetical protein